MYLTKQQLYLLLILIGFMLIAAVVWGSFSLGLLHYFVLILVVFAVIYSVSRDAVALVFYFSTMLLYYLLAPLIQTIVGVRYYLGVGYVGQISMLAFGFILCHVLGVLIGHLAVKPARSELRVHERNRPASFVGIAAVLMFMLSAIIIMGPAKVLQSRMEQDSELVLDNFGLFFYFSVKMMPVFLVVYWVDNKFAARRFRLLSPVFLFLLLLQSLVLNPVNTGRFVSLGGLLVVIVFILLRLEKKNVVMWIFAFFPFVALIVLPFTSILRGGLSNLSIYKMYQSFESLEFSPYTLLLDGMSMARFESGNYMLSHLFIFVPRSIWESKAGAIGADVAEQAGYVFYNAGINSFFDAYADYGFFGLFIASLLFGMLLRKADVFKRPVCFNSRGFVYSLILLVSMPIIFRGDLSTAMISLYASIVAYEICRLLTSIRISVGRHH